MKIGIDARFLTHPQPGGFKTYTENLVNALSKIDNVNSYFIYIDRPPDLNRLPRNDNFTFRVIPGTLPVLGMPIREQIGLKHTIIKDDLDIVHFLCNTAPVNISKKFLVTLHDTIQLTDNQQFRLFRGLAEHKHWAITVYSKWTILKSNHAAEGFITVSNYEKAKISEVLGIAPEKIWVTHLAPDPVFRPADSAMKKTWREEIRKKHGIHGRFLLGIGYEKRKNMMLIIKSFERISSHFPLMNLVLVVAEESTRLCLRNFANQFNFADRIVVLPKLPIGSMATLYNLAEVFVYPSERESFGLPPIEALACGTPTIAMDMSSLPEILGDGALMIMGKDPQIWANAIIQLLTNSELREDLVQRGLRQSSMMTWRQCAENTLQIYQAVAEKHRVQHLSGSVQ